MHNIKTLEKYFRKYLKSFPNLTAENFIHVDLNLLHEFDLLKFHETKSFDYGLTRYFQVIETPDKITLVNEEFVIWIVPENIDGKAMTYTIVAINEEKEPRFELVFLLSGVYNTSHLVLSVLERFLFEINENEQALRKLH